MKFSLIKRSIREILTITKYSVLMFFREKTAIFFSLFIPVMLMLIFGALNAGGGVKFNVAIIDNAKNDSSKKVVEVLKNNDIFKVTISEDKHDSVNQLKNGKFSYVLVLPENFTIQADIQQASAYVAQKIDIYYDMSQNTSTVEVGFTIFDKVFDTMTHNITRIPQMFELSRISVAGTDLRYIDFIIPGLVSMSVMQLSIFAVTGQIVSWRERGILKRLLATPIHPSVIIFSQIVSRVIITFMQASLLILMGIILFNLHIAGSLALVLGLIVMGGLIFLSMGFALSGIASTQNVVAAIANLFVFPQMLLSGIFFPRDSLPEWLNKITNFFPLTYFSDAMRQVMVKGADLYAIRGDILGLFVWALIMFVLAIKLFRWE